MSVAKLDLVRSHTAEYAAESVPKLVEIPAAQYLAVEGSGAPGGPEFEAKVGALYSLAFTIKMTRKHAGTDYKVGPLECLWWHPGGDAEFTPESAGEWRWKLLSRIPEFVNQEDLDQALDVLRHKQKPAEIEAVRLETMTEGQCVQALHIGPYDRENETFDRMQQTVREHGLQMRGMHHEIYLSDPRRVPPERIRTILRHPVESV